MSGQGYTRKDHRQRKRRSKHGTELLLDRLLKLFFYILVILVAIILVKIVFFNNEENNNKGMNNKVETSGQNSNDNNSSSTDSSTSNGIEIEYSDTEESSSTEDTSEETTTDKETDDEETSDSSTSYIPTGDYTVFDDSAFVGDSRIGGLYLSSQLTSSTFYFDVGGNVSTAVSGSGIELDDGSEGSVLDALKQREFENIFLQYGVNEWGWNTSSFISKYETLINEIKSVQPNANIYVLAIIPVTEQYATDRSEEEMDVNEKLDEMNAELELMAGNVGVTYINVVEAITGGERVLTEDMSNDGYHLNRIENLKMLDYICETIK